MEAAQLSIIFNSIRLHLQPSSINTILFLSQLQKVRAIIKIISGIQKA